MNKTETEEYIDLGKIFQILWKYASLILLVGIIFAALLFFFAQMFVSPQYEANALFYVNNSTLSLSSAVRISTGELSAASDLVDTYVAILQSRANMELVIEESGVDYTYEQLREMVSAKAVNSTGLFQVTVRSSDPEEARNLANRGIDLQRLTTDLINIAKETVVYSYSQDTGLLTVINEEQANKLASMFTVKELLDSIDYLMDVSMKYKDATDSLSYFEVCLLKMVNITDNNHDVRIMNAVTEPKKTENVTAEPVKTVLPEPVKPVVVEKPKEPVIKHLTNDQLYLMLTRSRKEYRERESKIWPEICKNVKGLENTVMMASSETDIIVVAQSREQTDIINEENKQLEIEKTVEEKLGVKKSVTAITPDQKILLISYFREKTGPIPIIKEEPKETISETEKRLINLFGKNGYKKTEE